MTHSLVFTYTQRVRLILAAIIFAFFAVFAPTSHGDRPLLFAEQQQDKIEYPDLKLPLARMQKNARPNKHTPQLLANFYFLTLIQFSLETPVTPEPPLLATNLILAFSTSPLIFSEILHV